MLFSEKYHSIINKGTEYHENFYDRKRVRFINLVCIVGLITAFPMVILLNLMRQDYLEILIITGIAVWTIFSLFLNRKGKNQAASIQLSLACMIGSYLAVFNSEVYVAAPYANLVIVFSAISMLKNRVLRNLISVLAFVSFVFETLEYLPVVVLLFIVYIAIRYSDAEYQHYQEQIEKTNVELEEKNSTIQKQTVQLLALQKEKHQHEIDLKEKDIESVLANNQMQLKIRQNILDELKTIKTKEGALKKISSLKMDLKSTISTQKKLDFTHEKYEEINAQFYSKLASKHPDLSKREKELCTYIKLGLSTKEMAALTNSSENTLYVTKNRLRKKLSLEEGKQINPYIINL
jgi:DNA-binding CsgD family transcriptional regulator